MAEHPHARFAELTFDDFQKMAHDEALTANERSGFPESYRGGAEAAILADIVTKLPALAGERAGILDLGCGATPLTTAIGRHCEQRSHRLVLVDGVDVLDTIPDRPGQRKLAGRFPASVDLAGLREWADAILVYSVLQFVFVEASIQLFLDAALGLLAPGGRLLIADLPNQSMRRRFLSGDAGRAFHREYMRTDEPPDLSWPPALRPELDDAAVLGLLLRAREAGFHAWLVPQADGLPMANRREDLLIERP